MSRLVVVNNVSLDGVMQAPGRADEDTRNGFNRGGWAVAYGDPVSGELMGKHMNRTRAHLLAKSGQRDSAAAAYAKAISLTTDAGMREVFANAVEALGVGMAADPDY